MIYGTTCWQDKIDFTLTTYTLPTGKIIETYTDLPTSLYESLCHTAAVYPHKKAIIDNYNRVYTYGDFLKKTDEFALYLSTALGITANSRVAVMLYSSFEFCVAYLALTKLGAVTIPLPTKMKEREITYLIDKSGAQHIICDQDFSPWLLKYKEMGIFLILSGNQEYGYGFSHYRGNEHTSISPDSGRNNVNLLLFTSGTTSQSKGVVLRNYNVMHAIGSYQKILGISSEDRSVIPIPSYHVTGLIALIGLFVHVGGTLYLHKYFNAKRVLECVKEHQITFLHGSPTVFSMLLHEAESYPQLPSLRQLACGSGYITHQCLQRIHAWLPNVSFHTVYGLTETSSPATIFPSDVATSKWIGSSGLPIPGTVLKIVDDNNQELAPGEVGEILISGTVVLDSYYNLKSAALQNGWLRTGDLGYLNSSGYLFVVDRIKDMVNRGGEKVWSYDVENALCKIPGVEEAAVVGVPDNIYGEAVAAVIKCTAGSALNAAQISNALHGKIATYKIPTTFIFCGHIPLTPNGKVDKKKIKTLFT